MISLGQAHREVTPLTESDCFSLFYREKTHFDFPFHFHEEYELNLIINAKGAQRVIGDHMAEIDDIELVLVGSNLPHGWFTHHCAEKTIIEVTIQFHKNLFAENFLNKNQLRFLRIMFDRAARGILFSKEITERFRERIVQLKHKTGFESVLELLAILNSLSLSEHMKLLSTKQISNLKENYDHRIDHIFDYMNKHYHRAITLEEVAKTVNMHKVSFSRLIRKRTGKNFVDSLNEVRLGHATRLLIDSAKTIAEIAFDCGFNNISNFNRTFKRIKQCTPKAFRESFSGIRVYI